MPNILSRAPIKPPSTVSYKQHSCAQRCPSLPTVTPSRHPKIKPQDKQSWLRRPGTIPGKQTYALKTLSCSCHTNLRTRPHNPHAKSNRPKPLLGDADDWYMVHDKSTQHQKHRVQAKHTDATAQRTNQAPARQPWELTQSLAFKDSPASSNKLRRRHTKMLRGWHTTPATQHCMRP